MRALADASAVCSGLARLAVASTSIHARRSTRSSSAAESPTPAAATPAQVGGTQLHPTATSAPPPTPAPLSPPTSSSSQLPSRSSPLNFSHSPTASTTVAEEVSLPTLQSNSAAAPTSLQWSDSPLASQASRIEPVASTLSPAADEPLAIPSETEALPFASPSVRSRASHSPSQADSAPTDEAGRALNEGIKSTR